MFRIEIESRCDTERKEEEKMNAVYSNYSPTVLYVDKYNFSSRWVYEESQIPYSIVRYIIAGSAHFVVNGERYLVEPGDVFYIPQGCRLYCAAVEEIVFISARFVGNIQLSDEDTLKCLWHITQKYNFSDQPQVGEWFERMYQSAISRTTYKRLETRGYINLICAMLARCSSGEEETEETVQHERTRMEAAFDMKSIRKRAMASRQKIDPRVRMAVDYITLHPGENLTRETLCRMCDVSESTLRRLFKADMGKNIYEFIKDTRMLYATHLLDTTSDPISEIGYQLGYESPSYFTKIFKENFGISPQDYRKISVEV